MPRSKLGVLYGQIQFPHGIHDLAKPILSFLGIKLKERIKEKNHRVFISLWFLFKCCEYSSIVKQMPGRISQQLQSQALNKDFY